MMQKIEYDQYGGPELMRLDEVDQPVPGSGQVLVRVQAAAANPMDWRFRNGDSRLMTGRRFPRGVGNDFAGTVVAVGDGVTRFKAGDDVLGAASLRQPGAFAEMVTADQKQVVRKPAGLSFEEAATLPTVGVAALQALIDKGELKAGQSVFINGCLGGVGRTAVQIAQMHGASVAGSCRDSAAADAKALGVDPVVGFDFDPAPLQGKFDVVLDTAGTLPIKAARTLLSPGGHIIDINVSPSNMVAKMTRSMVSRDYRILVSQYKSKDLEELARAAAQGELTIPVARTVPLAQAIGALTELERAHTPRDGKLVILPQATASTDS
jgi:NADPH:quinone reductase-like Zn-dependent oxidoreductase